MDLEALNLLLRPTDGQRPTYHPSSFYCLKILDQLLQNKSKISCHRLRLGLPSSLTTAPEYYV